jgi:hypothetical protein
MDEAVKMLPEVLALDRHAVRRRFEQRFSSTRMASEYVALYRSMLDGQYISESEKTLRQPALAFDKKLNGERHHNNRSHTAETREVA